MKHLIVGLEVLAAVAAGAAITAALAGPLQFDLPGASLHIRTLSRPIVAALVLLAVRIWLLRGPAFQTDAIAAVTRVLTGSLTTAAVIGWAAFLSMTCGGVDSYGYVSAADRLLAGDLVQEEPLAAILPFDHGIVAAVPLGYVPSVRFPNHSAPLYPVGLPAVMAVAKLVAGPTGPFLVAPIMGLVLAGASYALARAWFTDRPTALLAVAMVALNPVVFTYCIQPMSDVPAAATLVLAVAALSSDRRRPIVAGLAAALTLLIRPALAPAVVCVAAIPGLFDGRRALKQTVMCLVPVAGAVLLQGGVQWYLFGDARSTAYGDVSSLFSLETANGNVRSYLYWGFRTLGPVWLAAAAIGLAIPDHRRASLVTALVTGAVALPYLFYRPYDHWETLRFLLPIIVLATIVAAAGLMTVCRRAVGRDIGPLVAAVLTVAVASGWMSWLSVNQVFSMPAHEARHRLAGELVARATPADAVVLALQHSGSLRYDSPRQTINWDAVPSGALPETVRVLQARGIAVFVMIDSAEERAMFDSRHGDVLNTGGWLPSGQRRDVTLYQAPLSR